MTSSIEISAVIVIDQERHQIASVLKRYAESLADHGTLEFILVLDGALTETTRILKALRKEDPRVEILQFGRSVGASAALSSGFKHARGRIVITLSAVPTIDPAELPRLVDALEEGVDMIVARRTGPRMPANPKLDKVLQVILDSPFRDIRSDVRIMRAQVAAELTFYGTQHRFLPLIALQDGFVVHEVEAKLLDHSVVNRSLPDIGLGLDVLTVFFLLKFLRKPFRFFGGIGFGILAIGGIITAWLIFVRLFFDVPLADRPALILSTLMVVLGIQIIAVGLIGEIITFAYAREIKDYKVDRVVD